MKPRLKSSPAARDLIKRFEPFRNTAERGADGRWVVGYGHRAAARAGIVVSEEEASLLLIYDVMRAEAEIDELTCKPLARGQRDALISFVHDVGSDAFRNSDVARYLFEGRMEAAGEALAVYGDGGSARREAEAAMFLDALLPAVGRSQPVELVIRVEHPREERVLEGAIAGAGGRDREPAEEYVAPPPMPDRAITSRREAEAEIARILATVEAMPLEEREALARDEDDDAFAPMADVVADMSDAPVEGRYEAVEEADAVQSADAVDEDSAAARVAARMAQEIGQETGTGAAGAGDTAAPAQDAPGSAVQTGFELPDGIALGYALTRIPDAAVAAPLEAAAGDTAAHRAMDAPAVYSLDLPEDSTLGYVFASVMTGRFRPRPETAEVAPPDAAPAPVEAAEPVEDIAPGPDAAETEPETADAPGAPEEAVVEIVERALAVAGEDTPPPHPAELPAESVGAVGEVEAEQAGENVQTRFEVAQDDPMMEGRDPLTVEDEFSPHDLAADIHPAPEKPVGRTDDGGWGFLASFTAGAVVTAFGTISTWGDWTRMWSERSLTGDAWILVAGVFLMLVSAWFLGSVWLERLKQNRRDTAKPQ